MGLVGDEQVELRVLLDLDADLVEALDRGVAGKEVLRARAEGDDLEVAHADDHAGHGHKVLNHLGDLGGGADRIGGDVGGEVTHAQVVAAVEHATVGVATTVHKIAIALGGSHAHRGAVELLDEQGLRGLGTEVAEEHDERVGASSDGLSEGRLDVGLGLDGLLHLDGVDAELGRLGGHGGATTLGELDREAVARDGDDAELHVRDVG